MRLVTRGWRRPLLMDRDGLGLGGRKKSGNCAAALDDFAGVQDGDAMAERGDGEEIVGDIKDTHAEFAVELGEETEDFGLGDGVQGAGGLIGDEQGRTVEDGHGDDDALGLTDAELPGAAAEKFGVVGETHAGEGVADGSGAFFARAGGVSAPGFAELRADAKSGIERGQRALENDADFAAAEGAHLRFGFRGEVFPFEKEIAARCSAFQVKQAKNGERESALAGAALSDEAEDFDGLDLERDVAEDSGLVAVINGQAEGEEWRGLGHFCAPRAGSGPRRRTSAFQKACGSRTEGAEPRTTGEMADMASLLTR